MAAQPGWAACSVSTTGVSFGAYDSFSSTSLDSTGDISVSCDVSTLYSISLNAGGGSYLARAMAGGGHTLNYNLNTDVTRNPVWGDGSGGTVILSGSGMTANHLVYGRIPARQNAYVGSYSDIITVTLTF
jgi:spore coat protein U-like protein